MSAQLFFIISKEKTARFIALTGYGNAAGLLYDAGILTGRQGHKDLHFFVRYLTSQEELLQSTMELLTDC